MHIYKTNALLITLSCLLFASSCEANKQEAAGTAPMETQTTETEIAEMPHESTPAEVADEPIAEVADTHENQVLRHAVFFSFKEEATDEQIETIVKAFRELPNKIPEIIDFQWGTNNSPEMLDDGFTHCFVLTFKDEAGRDVYLPHPAHKEFGKTLGGLNDQVFVFDYWGTPYEAMEKELKHAVFFKFKDDAAAADIKKVEDAFAALPSKIDTIKAFEWGTNNSPERHSAGFTHCFMVTFDSEEGRAAYLPHPDHLAFVEILKPILDAPRVMDFWAEGAL